MSLPKPTPIGGSGGAALSNSTPAPLGSASAGASSSAARGDHVHAMPTAADVGADPAGSAAAAQAAAQAASQPIDADLTAIAALTSAADKVPYATGSGTWALATLTSAARTFMAAVDAAAQRLALGLGGAATLNVGTTAGTVAAGDDSRLSKGSQAVSTATVLSGAYDMAVRITASFNGAITLPASATAGRVITIIDEAGVGSGDANGSSTNLIHVLCAGSDTITAPGVYGSLTRMMLWKRYGVLSLRDDGAGGWHAIRRQGWHIDPRSISSLKWWIDSRRGITLNSTTVSAWSDLTGTANLSQSTAANQPAYAYSSNGPLTTPGDENCVIGIDSTDTMATSNTVPFTTGAMTMVLAYNYRWQNSSVASALVKSNEASTNGFAYFPNTTAVASCASAGNAYARGHGTSDDASGPFCSSVRNYQTNLDETVVDAIELSSARQDRRLNRTNLARTFGASATLDSFTQTLSVFNGLPVARLFNVMLFNASLSASDTFNLESALSETFK